MIKYDLTGTAFDKEVYEARKPVVPSKYHVKIVSNDAHLHYTEWYGLASIHNKDNFCEMNLGSKVAENFLKYFRSLGLTDQQLKKHISLDPKVWRCYIAIHEIGHALGKEHENQKSDAIKIFKKEDKPKSDDKQNYENTKELPDDTYTALNGLDQHSVMLNPRPYASGSGKVVQTTTNPDINIGFNMNLSELDKVGMNLLFKPLPPGPNDEKQLDIQNLSPQLAEEGH